MKRNISLTLAKFFVRLVCMSVLWGHCAVMAREQGQSLGQGELRIRLARLTRELAAEHDAFAKARESRARELKAGKATRQELAGQLLDGKIRLQRLKERHGKLEKEAQVMGARAASQQDKIKELLQTARTSAENLEIYLAEIPGDQPYISRIQRFLRNLPQTLDALEANTSWRNLRLLLEVQDRVHQDASGSWARRTKLRIAGGLLEEVKLLAVGNVAFAYETLRHGRIGLALASPADASGYRWTENLPGSVAGQVRQAITQVESAGSGNVAIPMDVTKRLRVDARLYDKTLAQRLGEGGPVMFPLAAVAILALLICIERIYRLYFKNAERPTIIRRVLAACDAKRYDEAKQLLDQSDTTTSRTLAACMRRREQGARAMEDGVQEQLLHELPRLRRFLSGLAILAAVAPLLGLLGTVTGIIQTFSVIRVFGNANPGLMAGGISEALITTATGLVIAIPILLCRGLLRGRMEKILGDAQRHAATLLNRLAEDG